MISKDTLKGHQCVRWTCVLAILLAGFGALLNLGPKDTPSQKYERASRTAARATPGALPRSASPGPPTQAWRIPRSGFATASEPEGRARLVACYGKLPLSFEANQGQTDGQVKFVSRGSGYTLFLTSGEAVLSLKKPAARLAQRSLFSAGASPSSRLFQPLAEGDSGRFGLLHWPQGEKADPPLQTQIPDRESQTPAVLRMKLVGANPAPKIEGLDELPGKSNYFIGNNPKNWRTDVPTYAKVKYAGVYPGVDLVYYGNQRQLEYDFVVAPGADPSAIVLGIQGARQVQIDAQENLALDTEGGELQLHKPVAYQLTSNTQARGGRRHVDVRYFLEGKGQVGFEVASYDASESLIIDPVVRYSTYLGQGMESFARPAVAVDPFGNAYITGATTSSAFPITTGAFDKTLGGREDAFVTKLNSTGSALIYSTFLGGSNNDEANGIAVDAFGKVYVTGDTASPDFPTTTGAFQPTCAGPFCVFITKLSATGGALLYSTYLGGGNSDRPNGVTIDSSGNIYVTGQTVSPHFPTTPGAFDRTCGSDGTCNQSGSGGPFFDGFVSKISPLGHGAADLVYSTYLGGSTTDAGLGIAVDALGHAYVTGFTSSSDFPTTAGAFQATPPGGTNAFVTKLNATGSALVYSTYLGGSNDDGGFAAIALDSAGNAYVTGETDSGDFPVTAGAFQTVFGGGGLPPSDAFVTKLNAAGTALLYSTFLGGTTDRDLGTGIAVDRLGRAYVTGFTVSTDFPTASPVQASFSPSSVVCDPHLGQCGDAFVAILSPAGMGASDLVFSTYLGGSLLEIGSAIAIDRSRSAYATGFTFSPDFPTTAHAFQRSLLSGGDAFVTKISSPSIPGVCLGPGNVTFPEQLVGTTSGPVIVAVSDCSSAPLAISAVSLIGANSGDFAITRNTCGSSLGAGDNCLIGVDFTPTAGGRRQAAIRVADDAGDSPQLIQLLGGCPPEPRLSGTKVSVVAGSGIVTVTLQVTNIGCTDADAIIVNSVVPYNVVGGGTVTYASPPLPISVGNLKPGASETLTLLFNVSGAVTSFDVRETGTLQDVAGGSFSFVLAQAI